MYDKKNLSSIDEARLEIFLKKYKANKNDNVLKQNIRKIDELTKEDFASNISNIWHNAFNSNVIPSLLENLGRN